MTQFEIETMMLEAENAFQEVYQEFLDDLAGGLISNQGAPISQEGDYAQPGSQE